MEIVRKVEIEALIKVLRDIQREAKVEFVDMQTDTDNNTIRLRPYIPTPDNKIDFNTDFKNLLG